MEAIRPQLSRSTSQQSLLSDTSTVVPETEHLGSAPSLAGLRQFTAKLGLRFPGVQHKPVDDLEKLLQSAEPTKQISPPTYQQTMNEPVAFEKIPTQATNVPVRSKVSLRDKANFVTAVASTAVVTVACGIGPALAFGIKNKDVTSAIFLGTTLGPFSGLSAGCLTAAAFDSFFNSFKHHGGFWAKINRNAVENGT